MVFQLFKKDLRVDFGEKNPKIICASVAVMAESKSS